MASGSFLHLRTKGWKTGRLHEIEIWFTSLEGRFYVIAERGRQSHWVQNIEHDPQVSFRVEGLTFEGRARIVDRTSEPELHGRVALQSIAKYGWGEGLVVELSPSVVESGERQ